MSMSKKTNTGKCPRFKVAQNTWQLNAISDPKIELILEEENPMKVIITLTKNLEYGQ